jgi:hypothetical protein
MAPRPNCWNSGQKDPGTHYPGGLLGSKAGLNAVSKRKVLAPVGNRTPVVQPVAQSLVGARLMLHHIVLT